MIGNLSSGLLGCHHKPTINLGITKKELKQSVINSEIKEKTLDPQLSLLLIF